MGKDRAAEARAAESREMARQFDILRKKAEEQKYDVDLVLENLKKASEEMPELVGLYEAVQRDPSALEEVITDPRIAEIQKGNLEAIQEMAEDSGFSEADMAKRRALQRQVSADEQARQKSIVQDLMQRGQAGSGTELLARLGSSQASAQRQAEASDRLAMDSSSARRAALAQASQQAGNLRGQQYNEQSNLASARDQIAAFNAMNRQNVQAQNLGLRQGLENQRASQKQGYYGNVAQSEQQRFANEMSKLGMQSNLVGNAGQARIAGVAPKANVGGMIGTIAGAGLGATFGGPQGAAAGGAVGGQIGSFFKDGGVRNSYANGLTAEQIAGRQTEADYANKNMSPYQAAMFGQRPQRTTGESLATLTDRLGSLFKSEEPKTTPMKSEEDIFGKSAFDDKENQKVLSEDLGVKEVNGKKISKNNTADTLGAIASVVGQLGKQSKPQQEMPKMNLAQLPTQVQNMTQFRVEDGGVKPSIDDMRDSLLSQVQAFAEGGVKYEDGGFDPSDERLRTISENRNSLLRQIEENKELGNLRANGALQEQLKPIEAEMIKNVETGLQYQDGGISPELREASQMLRQQAAPGAPMPGGQPPMPEMPIAPQNLPPAVPQGAPMMPMQQPPMPQGQMMADGGMAYEDGGEGTIIDSGMEMYAGDQLPDRINDGEMVLNVEQQDRLNDALMELKRLKSKERTDKMLADGDAEINPMQQESIMAFVRGEIDVDELPSERVVKEPSVGEPSGNMAKLLDMVSRKKR